MAGTLIIALAPEGRFTLEWVHSVEKEGWREEWQLTEEGLSNTRAAVKGSGAGMEPGEGGHWEGRWWVWQPKGQPIQRLVLAASGATGSGWRLCGADCVTLGSTGGEPILIEPCGQDGDHPAG
ncbi:DUF1850 domain-containing protein [Paracoccus sp. MBLB3053]|uniref:DUF1850 domain-containing protein n=1 Tax=Paracoccus aurantius TaxID=3073814 RepID=A0ABU2HZQ7_9RHOB|nr:DUF1850 domain-containing protein [Paracoccus sp. MBLB3053]MDS9470094.1 DUF1850 domain-containing protein [Paracoccus sp. MBLB3053]